MSRFSLIFLLVLLLVLAGIVALGFINTEVPPATVEKAMLNEAQAK